VAFGKQNQIERETMQVERPNDLSTCIVIDENVSLSFSMQGTDLPS
jgi:hypothetical protein